MRQSGGHLLNRPTLIKITEFKTKHRSERSRLKPRAERRLGLLHPEHRIIAGNGQTDRNSAYAEMQYNLFDRLSDQILLNDKCCAQCRVAGKINFRCRSEDSHF